MLCIHHNISIRSCHMSLSGNNAISYLPPEISLLENLAELNVGGNQIKFLPSEMLNMDISRLTIFPNSFIERSADQLLGPPWHAHHSRVPPLGELALRRLFRPYSDSSRETTLEATCTMPLDIPLPQDLEILLHDCVPNAIRQPPTKLTSEPIYGATKCRSPKHADDDPKKPSIFVRHMEERFTWENKIAGRTFGEVVFPGKLSPSMLRFFTHATMFQCNGEAVVADVWTTWMQAVPHQVLPILQTRTTWVSMRMPVFRFSPSGRQCSARKTLTTMSRL